MQTPARLHRAYVVNRSHNRPPLSEKLREREDAIIANAQALMASFAGDHFTIGGIALALGMSPATIRQHFVDVDCILAEILVRHLRGISRAIGKIPQDHPNRRAAARAVYFEATRTGWGAFTDPHLLLIQALHTLPEDLAKPIEGMHQMIGEALAGEQADFVLTLLDSPRLQPAQIEAQLTGVEAKAAPRVAPAKPAAAPAPVQAPVPAPASRPHKRDWKLARRLKAAAKQQARAGPPKLPP
jgi:AcrR family transcriptional regulator